VQDDNPTHFSEVDAAEAGYPTLVAPLTFLAIAGRRVQLDIFTKFSIPINIARVLHRDQKFQFHRPMLAPRQVALRHLPRLGDRVPRHCHR